MDFAFLFSKGNWFHCPLLLFLSVTLPFGKLSNTQLPFYMFWGSFTLWLEMLCNKGAFLFWIGSFGHMWPQQRDSEAENKPAEVTETRMSQRDSVQSLEWLIWTGTGPSSVLCLLHCILYLHHNVGQNICTVSLKFKWWQNRSCDSTVSFTWPVVTPLAPLWSVNQATYFSHFFVFFVSQQLEKFLSILSSILEVETHGY